MSISKRVKSPVAKPQGHGEEENFPSESSEELDRIDDPKVIDKAIGLIRTGKVVLKESVAEEVRLHLLSQDGKKFNVWIRPIDGQ